MQKEAVEACYIDLIDYIKKQEKRLKKQDVLDFLNKHPAFVKEKENGNADDWKRLTNILGAIIIRALRSNDVEAAHKIVDIYPFE